MAISFLVKLGNNWISWMPEKLNIRNWNFVGVTFWFWVAVLSLRSSRPVAMLRRLSEREYKYPMSFPSIYRQISMSWWPSREEKPVCWIVANRVKTTTCSPVQKVYKKYNKLSTLEGGSSSERNLIKFIPLPSSKINRSKYFKYIMEYHQECSKYCIASSLELDDILLIFVLINIFLAIS
jgi:hypothetical protein